MKPERQRQRGFTLIELVIVLIVIGIMAAALAPLALSSLRAYDDVLGDVVVLDKLRYATERLAREIREVNYDSTTGYAFDPSVNVNADGHAVAFTRVFYDASGTASANTLVTVGNTGAAVTLAYSGTGIAAKVLTDELGDSNNLVLSYLDKDGCKASNLTAPCIGAAVTNLTVRHVVIDLTLVHNNNPYRQRTQVELKNH